VANIKSQIKRNRQSERSRVRNKGIKSEVKSNMASFDKAITDKDKKAAESTLKKTVKSLDKAASKNIIHKNNAANKKSHLTKKLNSIS